MAPLPSCFLCIITSVIAREKQKKQLGSGNIADEETDAKNATVDGPLQCGEEVVIGDQIFAKYYLNFDESEH
jgi:hypothetical protein